MTNHHIISSALARVKQQAEYNQAHIVESADITRADREILVAAGWLQEIIRGWYMLVRPDVATGDTSAWYSNFWDFVRLYLQKRFANDYYLSAESSLDLHLDNPTTPRQVIVIAKQGAGLRTLPHETSLMIYTERNYSDIESEEKQGIKLMSLPYALCRVSPGYFQRHAREAELALRAIKPPSQLSRVLIRHHFKTAAARLLGAYQFLGDTRSVNVIQADLLSAGIKVNPTNPFQQATPLLDSQRVSSPYAGRIQAMWLQARDAVIQHFPAPPGLPKNTDHYLQQVNEIYQLDAYHSLSIEGYQVSYELIEQVKTQQWDPATNQQDNNLRNAMAAKGYFDTFQQVKSCIQKILQGHNAADIVNNQLQTWYRHLFGPSVNAGLITAEDLAGYRNDRVFIRNSRHSPPRKEAVVDAMDAFFQCLHNEPHAGVRAVLGHYFFVYIHPYMDGNGRIARFLMNTMLASGGYPWTVIRVENRDQYIDTLEATHGDFDLVGFTEFIRTAMD